MWVTLILIFASTEALSLSKNVMFRPLNHISTSRSKWLITLIHDLKPFDQYVNAISIDIGRVSIEVEEAISRYNNNNITIDNLFTFEKLQLEVETLKGMHIDFLDELGDLRSLQNGRYKRSLLPSIGDLGHALFGLVTESELDDIRRGIKDLEQNQETITHVVEKSLSLLNVSRKEISVNRQTINDLNKNLAKLDKRIVDIAKEFRKEILQLKVFVHLYLRLSLVVDDLKLLMLKAEFFLRNLHLQLNMLSHGRLSPSTITPNNLRRILLDIRARLPSTVKLALDPGKQLWSFYQLLTCSTLIENNMIIISITVPLFDINEGDYELFRAHNLPIPLNSNHLVSKSPSLSDMVAKYNLESEILAINRARTKYILLTEAEAQSCSTPLMSYCKVASPVYPINLSKLCIVALFMENEKAITQNCRITVVPKAILPLAEYISNGLWIVVTTESFKLSVSCQNPKPHHSIVAVTPPISLISLKATCSASSNYLNLTPFYFNSSKSLEHYSFDKITTIFNKSISHIWKPILDNFKTLTNLRLPPYLKNIKEISMDHLVHELHGIRKVELSDSIFPDWGYTIVLLVIVILALVIIGIIVFKKYKLNCLRSGKKLRKPTTEEPTKKAETEYIALQQLPVQSTTAPTTIPTTTSIGLYPEIPRVLQLKETRSGTSPV